jgi:hypothetical protein
MRMPFHFCAEPGEEDRDIDDFIYGDTVTVPSDRLARRDA